MDFVGTRVAFDDDPHTTPMQVLPGFFLYAVDVFSLEYRFKPGLGWRIERGVVYRGITAITELAVITGATEGAGDSQHDAGLSVQFRVRPGATFIDINALGKTLQGVISDHRVRTIIGNQVGEIPARGRARLEAPIIPARIQV